MDEQEKQLQKLREKLRKEEYKGLTEAEIKVAEQRKELRSQENIRILEDTLAVLERGYYQKDDKRVNLKCSPKEMRNIRVFLPQEISLLEQNTTVHNTAAHCRFNTENTDTLSLALKRSKQAEDSDKNVLVLNLASPIRPGGGVRTGAVAQEEDLCRKSSLLLSLESETAKEYYQYNQSLKTLMGSDAVMITPSVEVIRDNTGALLPDTFCVSVMTCAAPMVRLGLEGLSQEQYREMFYRRIEGMLRCAAFLGYRRLVLGAFGCGVFGNDAAIVSDIFRKVFDDFRFGGTKSSELFSHIDFAVLCREDKKYNFAEFQRNFHYKFDK